MKRLMIVADHSFVVQSIRLALRQTAGFQVVGCFDGRSSVSRALTELHRDPPGPVPGRGEGWMLDRVDADAVRELVAVAAMDGTSPLLSLEVRHLEGALGRPDPNGGALSHLEAPYVVYAVGAVTSQDAVASIESGIGLLPACAQAMRAGSPVPPAVRGLARAVQGD